MLALDRAAISNRRKDVDGRLHVGLNPICKACVSPYYGAEIPGWEELGLDPQHIYKLYRHPGEIAKALETANNVPILIKHIAATADDPQKEHIVGSTGTDAVFDGEVLHNTLVIWDQEGIDGIESDQLRELSPGYRYIPDMTPGVTDDGLRFDGVMRDIAFNHIAQVQEGRQGPDIIVGDSKETAPVKRTALLLHGALAAYIQPKMAQDQKVDLSSVISGVTAANIRAKRDEIVAGVRKLAKGKLAQDADLEDVGAAVDSAAELAGDEDEDDLADDEDPDVAEDEDPDRAEDEVNTANGKPKNGIDKPAMDAAIQAAEARTVERMNAAAQAREDVFPLVGKVSLALDTAEKVHKFALDHAKIDTTGVHPSAYGALVKMAVGHASAKPADPLALDAANDAKASLEKTLGIKLPVMKRS